MSYFPAFLKINNNDRVLIVGGGKTALHKVRVLTDFLVNIDIISLHICEDLREMVSRDSSLCYMQDIFDEKYLSYKKYLFVIAATDDRDVNHEISVSCKKLGIPVNTVDQPEDCTFIFPAIIKDEDVVAAVSSGGDCPPLTQYLKERISDVWPSGIGGIAKKLKDIRIKLKKEVANHAKRLKIIKQEIEKLIYDSRIIDINKGQVYIAGAGTGTKNTLTVGAYEILKVADVVVYDDLIENNILNICKSDAEKIYVGKRSGRHSTQQSEINNILIEKATEGKSVLRLKGGDPFVFGRGPEECLALEDECIPYELIPGVSAITSVPMSAGIPVTFREIEDMPIGARGVMVITGHTAVGKTDVGADIDTGLIRSAAEFEGTVLVFMGLNHIFEIFENMIGFGKDKHTPVAVISNGARAAEYIVRGSLSDIADRIRDDSRVVSPTLIVIGEAAKYDLRSSACKNDRKSVTVTGSDEFCNKISNKLQGLGYEIRPVPHMKIVPIDEGVRWLRGIDIRQYNYLVFTSKNSVKIFFDNIFTELYEDEQNNNNYRISTDLSGVSIATIGQATADYLRDEYGVEAKLVPPEYNSRALAKLLIDEADTGDRVIVPRAISGSSELHDMLTENGICCDEIYIYDTVVRKDVLASADICTDYVVFGSAQGARGVLSEKKISDYTVPICIGEYTARAVADMGVSEYIVAKSADACGIAEAIVSHSRNNQRCYGK